MAKKWLVIILSLVFFLRLPSFFEPFVYGDEGIYLTLGLAIRKGIVLYKEIHDNKPPLLYFLAALAGNFSTYRLLLFGWSLLTVYFFSRLATSLFPKKEPAVQLGTVLFAVLTSLPSFEGNIGNAENFMLLPTIIGFWLLIKNREGGKRSFLFFSGMGFALAALFKIPAAFDFFAALIFLALLLNKKIFSKKPWWYFLAGFIFPILITFVYFLGRGALKEYLTAAFLQNMPYLSSWGKSQVQTLGLPIGLFGRGFLLILIMFLVFFLRKKTSLPAQLVLLWFSSSLFAALLSSRPYPHYLLQVLPSLSLAFGLVFNRSWERTLPFLLSLLLGLVFSISQFWHYRNLTYYANFYQFALGRKTKSEYWASFGAQVSTTYRLAEFINAYTSFQEHLFIWGDQPSIYALSRRLPVGRYAVAYHIIDFNGFEETMETIKRKKPSLVVKLKSQKIAFPQLDDFLSGNYVLIKLIEDAEVYKINQR